MLFLRTLPRGHLLAMVVLVLLSVWATLTTFASYP
jgi:hypothetical protein